MRLKHIWIGLGLLAPLALPAAPLTAGPNLGGQSKKDSEIEFFLEVLTKMAGMPIKAHKYAAPIDVLFVQFANGRVMAFEVEKLRDLLYR